MGFEKDDISICKNSLPFSVDAYNQVIFVLNLFWRYIHLTLSLSKCKSSYLRPSLADKQKFLIVILLPSLTARKKKKKLTKNLQLFVQLFSCGENGFWKGVELGIQFLSGERWIIALPRQAFPLVSHSAHPLLTEGVSYLLPKCSRAQPRHSSVKAGSCSVP